MVCVKYILPKLLETGPTQTKQTTALPLSRHKISTPSNAISRGSCSAGPNFACPACPDPRREAFAAEWVWHSGAPLASPARPVYAELRMEPPSPEQATRNRFLIDSPKRLETRVTQTKQITEIVSNRHKIGPLPDANRRFPIATPKRLKTPLTQTKQTSEVISNRYKNRGGVDFKCSAEASAHSASRLVGKPGTARFTSTELRRGCRALRALCAAGRRA